MSGGDAKGAVRVKAPIYTLHLHLAAYCPLITPQHTSKKLTGCQPVSSACRQSPHSKCESTGYGELIMVE